MGCGRSFSQRVLTKRASGVHASKLPCSAVLFQSLVWIHSIDALYRGIEPVSLRTAARAQGIVDRYADGATVTVDYNPADPSDAVLERGGTSGIEVLYLIGGVFAAAGLLFLFESMTGRVHTS